MNIQARLNSLYSIVTVSRYACISMHQYAMWLKQSLTNARRLYAKQLSCVHEDVSDHLCLPAFSRVLTISNRRSPSRWTVAKCSCIKRLPKADVVTYVPTPAYTNRNQTSLGVTLHRRPVRHIHVMAVAPTCADHVKCAGDLNRCT